MWAGILAALTVIGQLISLGIKIWDAVKENDVEIKKQRTEILQSATRAVIDRDVERLNTANIQLRGLRQ